MGRGVITGSKAIRPTVVVLKTKYVENILFAIIVIALQSAQHMSIRHLIGKILLEGVQGLGCFAIVGLILFARLTTPNLVPVCKRSEYKNRLKLKKKHL